MFHNIEKWIEKMTAIKKYRKKILTKAKKYYKNNKDRLREQKKIGIENYLKKYIYIKKSEWKKQLS